MPDELWMEVRDIVQETGIKTIPKKKKWKKAKCLSEEALQIAVKTREVKSKGERESYTYLNAEFQRIARRDKKAFLSNPCKEIEENNRMGKTRDLFKKIRGTKGTFHAKMGSIKDRNGMDLTEAEAAPYRLLFSCSVRIFHCSSFSCGAQALGCTGFRSCDNGCSAALRHVGS